MLLPQRLKQLRQQRQLTQKALAQLLPINRGTYAHYELGKREPDLETLIYIAQFYGVSTDYLLGLTDLATSVNALIQYFQRQPNEYPLVSERGSARVADQSETLNIAPPEKRPQHPTEGRD